MTFLAFTGVFSHTGIQRIPQRITQKIKCQDDEKYRQRDKGHFPPDTLPKSKAGIVDHDSPGRFSLNTQPKETHKNFGTDGSRKPQ